MSSYGARGRGRQNRNMVQSRPGLLGAAPGLLQPKLLDSLSARSNPHQFHSNQQYNQHYEKERPSGKQGLLGNAPSAQGRPRERDSGNFETRSSYSESRDYSYDSRNEYDEEEPQERGGGGSTERLSPEVRQLMKNLGLSESDMQDLSRLPESDLSANNLSLAIRDLRKKKVQHTDIQQHDRRNVVQRREQMGQEQYGRNQRRSPTPDDLYDPEEPTGEHGNNQSHYDDDLYDDKHQSPHAEDAFSSFEQKWYSDEGSKKKKERDDRHDHQPGTSSGVTPILRGSRGPVAKSSSRWEREEPPPQRQPSRPPKQQQKQRISGLLGNPLDPSTQELDLLAATISGNRNQNTGEYRQDNNDRYREYQEQERYVEPRRSNPVPAPAPQPRMPNTGPYRQMDQIEPVIPSSTSVMLEAQIQAMQVLKSEALMKKQHVQQQAAQHAIPPLIPKPGPRDRDRMTFTKQEAQDEATKMRMNEGRVLYLRYRCSPNNIIPENELTRLAAPFEKVTNVLIVQPKNARFSPGWYQAFLELEHFDGAAAMLEHYMVRFPTVRGISIQVQRSNYQTLKLREQQRNKKRGRPFSISPDRSRQKKQGTIKSQSQDRNRNRSKSRDQGKKTLNEKKPFNNKQKQKPNNNKEAPKPKVAPPAAKIRKQSPKKKSDSKSVKEEDVGKKDLVKTSINEGQMEDFMLVDEVGEEPEKKDEDQSKSSEESEDVKKEKQEEKPLEVETEKTEVNGESKQEKEIKKEKMSEEKNGEEEPEESNESKLEYVTENIEQAKNMSEALLKIVQQNSTKAIVTDVLEYLAKSLTILKEIKM